MIQKIEPHVPQNALEAEVIEHGPELLAPQAGTLAQIMRPDDDPNHQAILAAHAARCVACEDSDGLLEETELAWMLGGYSEAQAAGVMGFAAWEWRMHVLAKGMHLTRNASRNQIRAELLYDDDEKSVLSHKERLTLMRDLDRAEGLGNPAVLKQVIEYRQQVLNIHGSDASPQGRLPDEQKFRDMPDDALEQIMNILDGYDDES